MLIIIIVLKLINMQIHKGSIFLEKA